MTGGLYRLRPLVFHGSANNISTHFTFSYFSAFYSFIYDVKC
jgi:hypothetical protein